ncbi:hypothetical protein Tco_0664779 [Tanacetum coccineum]
MTWVSWKKCLASKKTGGLSIGSIYGLNVGLLFKWIWRFLQNAPDLWIKTIKAICGQHGGIFDGSTNRSNLSPWCGILSSINSLKLKGIDLLALCIRKLGNGASIRFWEDVWHGTLPLKSVYLRVYLLESERIEVDIPVCANMEDWTSWLNNSHLFKKVRVFLDGEAKMFLQCVYVDFL